MKVFLGGLFVILTLFGCSSPTAGEQAKRLGSKEFSKATWSAATQDARGEMVASMLAQTDFKTLNSAQIKELLGKATGYFEYDEYPAYFVGPSTVESKYGKGYLLAFITDKATGKVTEIKILPEPK